MHLSLERLAALITIAGAVMFLAAAFQPTFRVFIEPSGVRNSRSSTRLPVCGLRPRSGSGWARL